MPACVLLMDSEAASEANARLYIFTSKESSDQPPKLAQKVRFSFGEISLYQSDILSPCYARELPQPACGGLLGPVVLTLRKASGVRNLRECSLRDVFERRNHDPIKGRYSAPSPRLKCLLTLFSRG